MSVLDAVVDGIFAVVDGILMAAGPSAFRTETQIGELVRDNNETNMEKIDRIADSSRSEVRSNDLRALRIFATDQQQTWLVADLRMAYCVLDDRQFEKPRVEWRQKLENVLPVRTYELTSPAQENWTTKVGVLHFGDGTTELYYSKELFQAESADVVITGFLSGGDG